MAYIRHFLKYRGLIEELISRDIKVKYRRSALGYIWTVLNPLMMMVVMALVFSNFFRFDIENYTVYLLSGQLIFNFFSEATNQAMSSVVGNRSLLTKVHLPKYIFPLAKVISSFVNLLFSLVAIVIMLFLTRSKIHVSIILFIFPILYAFLLALGCGLILSVCAVFFRDIYYIYSVVLTALTYFTPIFYPVSILPKYALNLIKLNPLYYIVEMFRKCVMYGTLPTMQEHIICFSVCMVFLIVGLIVFKKAQDDFVMYI